MSTKETLIKSLDLTESQFNLLADYGYSDYYAEGTPVETWQRQMITQMQEQEALEEEYGPIWEGNDKRRLMDIFFKKVTKTVSV